MNRTEKQPLFRTMTELMSFTHSRSHRMDEPLVSIDHTGQVIIETILQVCEDGETLKPWSDDDDH